MKRLLLCLVALLSGVAQAGTVTGILQGPSGLPVRNATLTFQLQQAGLIVGSGAVANITSQCYSSTDGSVHGLPNPLTLPITAVSYGSGQLPGGIYYLQYTFLGAIGETLPSPEVQIQLTGTGSIIISPPISIPAGVTGINIYAATTSGGEQLQGQGLINAPFILNFPGLIVGTPTPTSNSSPCTIAFNDTIIPYSGYTVSLTSSTGNAYPGWPQAWQLNGGLSGTINVSNGAPLWNGTVIYPMPILSQPLNHGPQSISGNLDFGGYNVTNVGNLTAGEVNTVLNPNQCSSVTPPSWCAGSDIGAWVNAALQSCSDQCTVYVPAGSYSYSTTILLPLNIFSSYTLLLDQGAVLTYTGSGDAIQAPVNDSPNVSNWRVHGGQLIGNAAAASGVHVLPTNSASITGMLITGFSNGPGIWLEGTNGVTIFNNVVQGNQVGVKISPTFCNGAICGTGVTGSPYSPNQIAVLSNRLTNNSQWGFLSSDPVTTGLSGALNVVVSSNDLEINGTGGSQYGALSVGRSHGLVVSGNYFEGSPQEIVLGIPGGNDGNQFRFFASQGPQIINNFFTNVIATPYDINLLDTADAQISGNTTNQVSANSSNCFINTLAQSGLNIGETGTLVGKNHVELYSGMGNYLCIAGAPVLRLAGAGSYTAINTNYFPFLSYQNFAITSAASDVVNAQFVLPGDSCYATSAGNSPSAVSNAQAIIAQVYVVPGTSQFTIYHPTGDAGLAYNVFCTGVPN